MPLPGAARRRREFSDEPARAIDAPMKSFVDTAFQKALQILTERPRRARPRRATAALQKETLTEADLEALQSLEPATAL